MKTVDIYADTGGGAGNGPAPTFPLVDPLLRVPNSTISTHDYIN